MKGILGGQIQQWFCLRPVLDRCTDWNVFPISSAWEYPAAGQQLCLQAVSVTNQEVTCSHSKINKFIFSPFCLNPAAGGIWGNRRLRVNVFFFKCDHTSDPETDQGSSLLPCDLRGSHIINKQHCWVVGL